MAILGSAAAEPWNGRGTPSIWPELEVRIQRRAQQSRPTLAAIRRRYLP